jgi:hypothetical protein
MSILKMSDEEKKRILDKHKNATKDHNSKTAETKKGLQKPEDNKKTS